jgi:MSHA pilin protein MshA
MNRQQTGFTLIELVIVIIIIGLLAAAAVPRFSNMSQQARIAAVNGVAGGAASAASVVRAQYLVTGLVAGPITVDGQAITVVAGANGGIPDNTATGIAVALTNYSGFTFAAGAPSTFTPTTGGSATCQVRYNGTAVTVPAAGAVPAIPAGGAVPVTTGC